MPSSLPSPPPERDAGRRPRALLSAARLRLALHARRKVTDVLDGEYGSVHRGRSMDFDDLREYVLGDDVRDLDWKATARSGRPLIRRHVATRRHTVLLVVDTGRTMAALASPTDSKRDVAVCAAGIVGDLALRHGDSVGLVAAPVPGARNEGRVAYRRPGRGEAYLEELLRTIDDAIDASGEAGRLGVLLDYVARHFRRRMILVVVADDGSLGADDERRMRRLAAQHEVLFVAVGDVAMTDPALAGRELSVVGTGATVPPFFRAGPALHADLLARQESRTAETARLLARVGVAATRLVDLDSVPGAVIELLGRQRRLLRRSTS